MDNLALLKELPQVNMSDFDNYPATNPSTQAQTQSQPNKKRSRAAAQINAQPPERKGPTKKLRTSYLEEYGFQRKLPPLVNPFAQ